MSNDHLGERLSALVDGELGPAEHERALIHLAKCEACRFEADMTRRLKQRLNGMGGPEPDLDFMGRLSSLDAGPRGGGPDPFAPSFGGGGFGSAPPLGSSRPLGGFPADPGTPGAEGTPGAGDTPGGERFVPGVSEAASGGASGMSEAASGVSGTASAPVSETAPPARAGTAGGTPGPIHLAGSFSGGKYAVAALAVTTTLLGTAFVAGGEPEDTPVVEPRVADYAVEHAVTSRHLPVEAPPGAGPPAETYDPPHGAGLEQTGR